MRWFSPSSPVTPDEEAWLEENLAWLAGEFEPELLTGPVLLPTPDDLPVTEFFSHAGASAVLRIVAGRMGVDPGAVDLDYHEDEGLLPYEAARVNPRGYMRSATRYLTRS